MIVIGDVHGHFSLLMDLFDKLPQTKDICFVGDLIDRGPDSKKVIDFIRENGYHCVMGNHEDMFLYDIEGWVINGGKKTLKSFNTHISRYKTDMIDYIKWMVNLPVSIEWEGHLITHSYAYNGKNTPESDILWNRSFNKDNCDLINIFGHTPVEKPVQIFNKHWNIDTGAFYTGVLTAIDLKTGKFYKTKEK
jgi:serine/threonine protein phosphatase 1